MDRLNQLKGEPGASRDSTLDVSSPLSEAYLTANESSSKYFSLSEEDSTFDINPTKDEERPTSDSDQLISNLSPIPKKNDIGYKLGKQIEAANILSGGVDIFDDNDNSFDGSELVIDDNVNTDEERPEEKNKDSIEVEGGVDVEEAIPSKDTEVVLQIDGKNVDAIDIGNGLYLYRRGGEQEELAAVQIVDTEEQPSFKFLKVRENAEGNLEVYEEFEVEVPKEMPAKGVEPNKKIPNVPAKDMGKVISKSIESSEKKLAPQTTVTKPIDIEKINTLPMKPQTDTKTEVNLNGKTMKFNDAKKSPIVGSFKPMTYHSTPNKEGIPLTKTMVDQQLQPSRHSESAKKKIEVNTESCKQKTSTEAPVKSGDDEGKSMKTEDVVDKNKIKLLTEGLASEESKLIKDIECKTTAEESTKCDINLEKNEIDKTPVSSALPLKTVKPATDVNICADTNATATITVEIPTKVDTNLQQIEIDKTSSSPALLLENIKPAPNINITADTNATTTITAKVSTKVDTNQKNQKDKTLSSTTFPLEEGAPACNVNITADTNATATIDMQTDISSQNTNTEISNDKSNSLTDQTSSPICANVPGTISIEDKVIINATDTNQLKDIAKKGNDSAAALEQKEISKEVHSSSQVLDNESKLSKKVEVSINKIHDEPEKSKVNNETDINEQKSVSDSMSKLVKSPEEVAKTSEPVASDSTFLLDTEKDLINIAHKKPETANLSNDSEIKDVNAALKFIDDSKKEISKPNEIQITAPSLSMRENIKIIEAPAKSSLYAKPFQSTGEKAQTKICISPKENDSSTLDLIELNDLGISVSKNTIDKSLMDNTFFPQAVKQLPQKSVGANKYIKPETKSISTASIKIDSKTHKISTDSNFCNMFYNSSKASKVIDDKEFVENIVNKAVIMKNPQDTNVIPEKNITAKTLSKPALSTIIKPPEAITEIGKSNSQQPSEIKPKPLNNNAVPFGKWTEANKQEYLNKIKETKVTSTNTNQIKQPKDLNRRDVLKKIDSQRQSINMAAAKSQEYGNSNKNNMKIETPAFTNKVSARVDSKIPLMISKVESKPTELKQKSATTPTTEPVLKVAPKLIHPAVSSEITKPVDAKIAQVENNTKTVLPSKKAFPDKGLKLNTSTNVEQSANPPVAKVETNPIIAPSTSSSQASTVEPSASTASQSEEAEAAAAAALSNMNSKQDVINKAIEDILLERVPPLKRNHGGRAKDKQIENIVLSYEKKYSLIEKQAIQEIEMKMNELHGIPFVERPPHELPTRYPQDLTGSNKTDKSPKPSPNKGKASKVPNIKSPSKEEKSVKSSNLDDSESDEELIEHEPVTGDIDFSRIASSVSNTKGEANIALQPQKDNVVTEKDFDKFTRRTSAYYDNNSTVNYEKNQIVVKSLADKSSKIHDKKEVAIKSNLLTPPPLTGLRHSSSSKFVPVRPEDSFNKNYHSKLQIAYQSAITAKQHKESPITVIEDKPVRVLYMETNTDYNPTNANMKSSNISPTKKGKETEIPTYSSYDTSLDSEVVECVNSKTQEITRKVKHQRKQVLTPVEAPDLEVIEAGSEVSPKKKRKTDDLTVCKEKSPKNILPKKTYLLGRSAVSHDSPNVSKPKNIAPMENSTASAIDSLVKAAELLENQAEKSNSTMDSESSPQTSSKRGRGRPRKYPLPEGAEEKNTESPQKKTRIEKPKYISTSEEDSSSDEMIRENWTMGKINEDIVCPICHKLFRSENVVFKHVKHCTGPSPNRSDSDKRSTTRSRRSQESDSKSFVSKSEDLDYEDEDSSHAVSASVKRTHVSRKSEIIVIEDTPIKEKKEPAITKENKTATKLPTQKPKPNNLVCEFCGKIFRQLSYLVSHKLQHKNEEIKDKPPEVQAASKSIFSCEVCKKEFRKLHHLVQHRIIHNPPRMPPKMSRKSSVENSEKALNSASSKGTEDQSAGFRCERCDKSFRKLHHLVEHRETHEGQETTKQKPATTSSENVEKPTVSPPQCDVCKKTFRKLHHLSEHKEQHEISDRANERKNALSAKDIIHECSLCYMVFPNEHSLNKHMVACQRKKRQSAATKPGQGEQESEQELTEDKETTEAPERKKSVESRLKVDNSDTKSITKEESQKINEVVSLTIKEDKSTKKEEETLQVPEKIPVSKTETKPETQNKDTDLVTIIYPTEESLPSKKSIVEEVKDIIVIEDTPKKKIPKAASTVTKKRKSSNSSIPKVEDTKPLSDEDEIRYMLNPDFKEDSSEGKFMKIRTNKRNSLQIERPNSKELITRRISLQHLPKVIKPKLKPETKTITNAVNTIKPIPSKLPKLDAVPVPNSDDTEIKYSFPKRPPEKVAPKEVPIKETGKIVRKKSLGEKRKSLTSIAKRKTLGRPITPKNVPRPLSKVSPLREVKKRLTETGHRCDCGQLFSSATLLSRHTTLAHTPPRIRKRRSPPPETAKPKTAQKRKLSVKSETKPGVSSRKSNVKSDVEIKTAEKSPKKKVKTEVPSTAAKLRRNTTHKGVPVPEKMKKIIDKLKK